MKWVFFLDFDSTITQDDFCTRIPSVLQKDPCLKFAWESLSKQFQQLYCQVFAEQLAELSKTQCTEENLFSFCNALDGVEQTGVQWVEQHKVLQGILREDIRSQAKSWIREDENWWKDLAHFFGAIFKLSQQFTMEFHCVSCTWSYDVLQAALEEFVGCVPAWDLLCENELVGCETGKPLFKVFCNDLRFDEQHVSTGQIDKRCVTSSHKLAYMQSQLLQQGDTLHAIYLGDSLSDLKCLFKANLPILWTPWRQDSPEMPSIVSLLIHQCEYSLQQFSATKGCSLQEQQKQEQVILILEEQQKQVIFLCNNWAEFAVHIAGYLVVNLK